MGKKALVVGGTGMLAGVVSWLVEEGYQVAVIGRRREMFERLQEGLSQPSQVEYIQLDYHQTAGLEQAVQSLLLRVGALDLVVSLYFGRLYSSLAVQSRDC